MIDSLIVQSRHARLVTAAAVVACCLLAPAASAGSFLSFSKAFAPSTIGPGSTSRLVYTIVNASGPATEQLSFDHNLPGGMTVASVAGVTTSCVNARVSTSPGATSISVDQGRLVSGGTCQIEVNVVATVTGTSTTSELSSSQGNVPPASATLTVDTSRPAVTAGFSPAEIPFGADSRLTITLDNTLNPAGLAALSISGRLPGGLVISAFEAPTTTCGAEQIPATITAAPGQNTFSVFAQGFLPSFVTVPAGGTCILTLSVQPTRSGIFDVVTNDVTVAGISAGFATARLNAEARDFTRVFQPRSVPPGGSVQAVYTLNNFNRMVSATDIAFTDDFGAAVPGAVVSEVSVGVGCGAGADATGIGTGVLTFADGTLGPAQTCTFTATIDIPPGAPSADFSVTSSPVSYSAAGQPRVWDAATDVLAVEAAPTLVKSNSGPAGPGGEVTLTYLVTNTSTQQISNLTFDDSLPEEIPGVAQVFPSPGFCGAGSTMTLVSPDIDVFRYRVQGVELAPSSSCTFDVVVTLPALVGEPGLVEVTSSLMTATLPDQTVLTSPQVTDTLTIVAGPRVAKEFGTPASAGGLVDLTYTITADSSDATDATEIAFSDTFDAVLAGLVIESTSTPDVCGAGSALTIDGAQSTMTFSGGTLAPGETCSFSIQLAIPVGTSPGSYLSTSSDLTASLASVVTIGAPATDTLLVDGVQLTMSFPQEPIVPGADTLLSVTMENVTNEDATDGFFLLNLGAALAGLSAFDLPVEPCGAGSTLTGTTFVIANTFGIPAQSSCTFSIPVRIPPGSAAIGTHLVRAEGTITMAQSGNVTLQPALARLVVTDSLMLSAAFLESATNPGGEATLHLTVAAVAATTNVNFTVDLDAALPGLVGTGLPLADVCGAGSTVVGTNQLSFAAPNLAQDSVCEFDLSLVFPSNAPTGLVRVQTSPINGVVEGVGVQSPGSAATIDVFSATVVGAFAGPSVAGGTAVLGLTLTSETELSGLDLVIDLDAFLPGAVAVGLPQGGLCGSAALEGTSTVVLRGADLDGVDDCEISLQVAIPEGTGAGVYPLAIPPLTQGGEPVAEATAPAILRVEPPPQLALAVDPELLSEGSPTTLTLTIDNSASVLSATDVALDVALPTGVVVAGPTATTSSTCDGGTLTAVSGADSFSLEGASVASASTCEVQVSVTGDVGEYTMEPVTLLSSNGSGVSDPVTFTIEGAVSVSLAASASAVFVGSTTTVTATLANPSIDRDAEAVAFNIVFVGELAAADPLNAETNCGGALTADTGAIAFADGVLLAEETCTVTFDVAGEAVDFGAQVTTENGTSALGPIADASVAVGVEELPSLSAAFDPAAIGLASTSELVLTATGAVTLEATDLEFSIVIPAGLEVEFIAPLSAGCTGADISQSGQTLTFTADSLAAAATCVVRATIQPTEAGVFDVETSPLSTGEGEGEAAAATLTVTEDAPEPDPAPGEPGVEPGAEPGAEPGVEPGAEPGGEPGQEPDGTPEAEPPADGCGCSASEDNSRSTPLGVLAVLWGAALLRRRRRTVAK